MKPATKREALPSWARLLVTLLVTLLGPACAHSQLVSAADTLPTRSSQVEKLYSFTFKPVVLDTESSSGTALGLDYELKGKYQFAASQTGAGSDTFNSDDLDKTFKRGQVDLRARGTLASSKEKSPNKLLDFAAAGVFVLDAPSAYYKIGGTFMFETDQGFDSKQRMFGISGSVSKVGTLIAGDAGSVLFNYGTVKPTDDSVREKLIGNLDSFKRWDAEISYTLPINRQKVRSVDLDYRQYQEVSAPGPIRAEGLDRHRLGLIRVNLDNDFFLQYSRGSLPFDQKSERAVKIGWSLKFE